MVIDDATQKDVALQLLNMDMGREKTQWFYSNKISESITNNPGTGILIGKITSISKNEASVESSIELKPGYRLRVRTQNDSEPITFTISKVLRNDNGTQRISPVSHGIKPSDELSLVGTGQFHFPSQLTVSVRNTVDEIDPAKKQTISAAIKFEKTKTTEQIYLRINQPEWIPLISFQYIDQLIVSFNKTVFQNIDKILPEITANKEKIWIELPQFISEKNLIFYKKKCEYLAENGFSNFVLSHLSQQELIPNPCHFATNENVYCYNDAAVKFLFDEKARWVTSPFENELTNLFEGTARNMVIPMYYYPKLFYSRQPISLNQPTFSSEKNKFKRIVVNGITHILPTIPVSLLQYKHKLVSNGFTQFLIDLSFEEPSKATLKRIFTKLKKSEDTQPSTTFNFKKGLK